MSRDDMVRLVVPLSVEDRKLLLNVLIEEMDIKDADEVLAKNGYTGED